MLFQTTTLQDLYVISFELKEDERGFFTRSFCSQAFMAHGLHHEFVQCNYSYNKKRGTLRGLHYQIPPHAETKMVACRRGAIFDVAVDIRPHSPTYGQWFGITLSETSQQALYIPAGFAHGFQTLVDETEVSYWMGHYFNEQSARGIVWDDPALSIAWPVAEKVISEKDKAFPRMSL